MHIVSTNFAKMLVWKHEYDMKLWCHKQRTRNTNDHHIPLNDPPHENFVRAPLDLSRLCPTTHHWINHTCQRMRSGNNLQGRNSINWIHSNDHYVSLTISILWIWNVKLGNFIYQEGNRACESAHGDILSVQIPDYWHHIQIRP